MKRLPHIYRIANDLTYFNRCNPPCQPRARYLFMTCSAQSAAPPADGDSMRFFKVQSTQTASTADDSGDFPEASERIAAFPRSRPLPPPKQSVARRSLSQSRRTTGSVCFLKRHPRGRFDALFRTRHVPACAFLPPKKRRPPELFTAPTDDRINMLF